MDTACLDHVLTEAERATFEQNGYLVVENALTPEQVEESIRVIERVNAVYRPRLGMSPHGLLHLKDFVGKDPLFLDLLTWPTTFPKVWGILGWHIQLYLSHLNVSPTESPTENQEDKRLGWHQDSGRLNRDIETSPRPRISVKVAFFLSDTTQKDCGNFYVIPGSHLQNKLDMPGDKTADPPGATAIQVPPGTAVIFDRRIWHSRSLNYSPYSRKVLFYGYSYRWLRPRDDHDVTHILDRCTPIQKQLLGISYSGGMGYTSPKDEDIPLKFWIEEHLGKEAVAP